MISPDIYVNSRNKKEYVGAIKTVPSATKNVINHFDRKELISLKFDPDISFERILSKKKDTEDIKEINYDD